MAMVEVDLFTDEGNNAVVRLPGRRYPGIVIQGDALNVLVSEISEVIEILARREVSEAEALLHELEVRLQDTRARYEKSLRERGIALPY